MEQIIARKLERRKQLAALPVGEKLRMLEEMVAAAKVISANRPIKPPTSTVIVKAMQGMDPTGSR